MRRVCIGYDPRQPLSFNVMQHSVQRHASKPIAMQALILEQLPITRQGATEFTFSRFLVPWLSGYEGWSVFCDEDQACLGDIHELLDWCEADSLIHETAVYVNQNQPRFEWPSVMVFNNARCRALTPEYVQEGSNILFDFAWADSVGSFPEEWNVCIGWSDANPNIELVGKPSPKLLHWTMGIPYWPECRLFPEQDKFWWAEHEAMLKSVEWIDLHRHTKHFPRVMSLFMQKYGINLQLKEKAA